MRGVFCYNTHMKNIIRWLDPYKQSFFYFRWTFWSFLIFVGLVWWACTQIHSNWLEIVLDNRFVYLPNYLTHEFSHRIWCGFRWEWWCYASGNAMETLIPLVLCVVALGHRGGRYLLPFLLYWLSTTLYGAGIYAADARAMKMALTSSDMLSNYAPGTMKGDWWYILQPLGLLEQDVLIGNLLLYAAAFTLVLAVWSLWYYWTHTEQYFAFEQDNQFF